MIDYVHPTATVLMLATIAVPLFAGVEGTLRLQLALMPLANVYCTGISLVSSVCWKLMVKPQRSAGFTLPWQVCLAWGIWLPAALISLGANGCTPRMLFQVAEFLFYGILSVSVFQVCQQRREAAPRLIRSLSYGGLLVSLFFTTAYGTNGVTWTEDFLGPNEVSFLLLFMGICAPAYLICAQPSFTSIRWVVIIGSSLVTILLSESRGGIALAIALCGVLVSAIVVRFSAWKMTCAFLIVAVLLFKSSVFMEQVQVLFDVDTNFSNLERIALIRTCVMLFQDKPLTGWGWGSMEELLPKTSFSDLEYPHPHNTYAHFMAELGVSGLVFLAVLMGTVGTCCWRCYRTRRYAECMIAGLSLATLIAQGLIEDYFYGASRAMIVCVMVGIIYSLGENCAYVPAHSLKLPPRPVRTPFPVRGYPTKKEEVPAEPRIAGKTTAQQELRPSEHGLFGSPMRARPRC